MNGQQQAFAGATGVDLIVSLYDGWLRFLNRAVNAVDSGDAIERRYCVKRALDILMYLEARLRPDTGEVPSGALSEFYAASITKTLEASHAESREDLLSVIASVRNVRDAWIAAARDPAPDRTLPRELRTASERRVRGAGLTRLASPSMVVEAMHWSA